MQRKDTAGMMKNKKRGKKNGYQRYIKMADRWHVINFSELNVTVIDWA